MKFAVFLGIFLCLCINEIKCGDDDVICVEHDTMAEVIGPDVKTARPYPTISVSEHFAGVKSKITAPGIKTVKPSIKIFEYSPQSDPDIVDNGNVLNPEDESSEYFSKKVLRTKQILNVFKYIFILSRAL